MTVDARRADARHTGVKDMPIELRLVRLPRWSTQMELQPVRINVVLHDIEINTICARAIEQLCTQVEPACTIGTTVSCRVHPIDAASVFIDAFKMHSSFCKMPCVDRKWVLYIARNAVSNAS